MVENPDDFLRGNAGNLVIGDGRHHPARGDYDLVIGDNPNGEGQVVLRLLERYELLSPA